MITISRTIRFKERDLETIDEFLEKNPFFDFSSLTRIALTEFIKNPSMQIVGVISEEPTPKPERKIK
jgi:hypothetical protein